MRRGLVYTILSVVTVASLACCAYLYIQYKDSRDYISKLSEQNRMMGEQIDARNSVIDKALGINISEPLSLSNNYEQVKQNNNGSQKKEFNIISADMSKEIIVPLYAPDGYYFGEISYAAYLAIINDKLQGYESLNDEEMKILHSYMNYITLDPGMSLIKY